MDAVQQTNSEELSLAVSIDKDVRVLKDFELAAAGGGIADVIGI